MEVICTPVGRLRVHTPRGSPPPEGYSPVVLVRRLVVSSYYMVPTFKRLAAYYLVYAPNLPGFGESEKPRRVLDVTGLSDSFAAWMRKIGLERAALLGNYFGYQIKADLAVHHPERFEQAVLQNPVMNPG